MAPFPWFPMMALAIGLTSHSFCLTNLFPYAGYMVQHMGVTDDKDAAGYYAGYLASAFMFGRFFSSYSWGRFSDRYGRLPVYNISLWTMVLMQVAFGLSTNYYWAITFRLLLGALNGTIGTSKTMISEICGPEHEVVGMSFITATWSIGFVIGPAAGGLLAEPAVHYPHFFAGMDIFKKFPYLLPNLFAAGLALVALPMSYLFLYETHPPCRARADASKRTGFKPLLNSGAVAEDDANAAENGTARTVSLPLNKEGTLVDRYGSSGQTPPTGEDDVGAAPTLEEAPGGDVAKVGRENGAGAKGRQHAANQNGDAHEGSSKAMGALQDQNYEGSKKPRGTDACEESEASGCREACLSPIRLLSEKRVREVMLVCAVYSFIHVGLLEAYPLWAISTVANGGLDWTTKEIGEALSLVGMLMMIFQVGVYPMVVKKIGMKTSHRWASIMGIFLYGGIPLLALLRENEALLLVVSVLVVFLGDSCSCAIFVNLAVATNNAVDASRRGELNGLGMAVHSMARALGPVVFSVIFAWSIDRPRPFPFGPHLAFLILGLGMLVVAVTGWTVMSEEGKGGVAKPRSDEAKTKLLSSSS